MDPVLQTIINIGALATALGAVIGLPLIWVKVWPVLKKAVGIVGVLETLPEMATELGALSISVRTQGEDIGTIKTEVDAVKQQVKNSHKTNLREDVDEVKEHVVSLHEKLDMHLNQTPTTTTVNINPRAGQ